jgi:hypothetical protein
MEEIKIKAVLGTSKKCYAPKQKNVKKLKVYLNKIENGS